MAENEKCRRSACRNPHDGCKHLTTGELYCRPCAHRINSECGEVVVDTVAKAENGQCPKCGAEQRRRLSAVTYYACGSCVENDEPRKYLNEPETCLRRQLAAALVVIDKLPTYADTGQPFVPGVDDEWVRQARGDIVQIRRGRLDLGPVYSTEAAALAAKEAGK